MSEGSPFYGPMQSFHDWPDREPDVVAAAFYETFTAPSGRIVLEELYKTLCLLSPDDVRNPAMLTAWKFLVDTIRQHVAYQRAKGSGDAHAG